MVGGRGDANFKSLRGPIELSIHSTVRRDQRQRAPQRERDVLRLIVEGRTNTRIGTELGVSRATVTSVCGRIFKQLGVTDRTQAAVWAMKNLSTESTTT